jgi:hypothetical protein
MPTSISPIVTTDSQAWASCARSHARTRVSGRGRKVSAPFWSELPDYAALTALDVRVIARPSHGQATGRSRATG